MNSQNERIPPQSHESERIVLGTMLCDSVVSEEAVIALNAACFYSAQNRSIFETVKEMVEKSIPVDASTLKEELRKKNVLEFCGDSLYIADLMECVSAKESMEYHFNLLKEKATLRALISHSMETQNNCFNEELETTEILNKAECGMFEIAEDREVQKSFGISELILPFFTRMENYQNKKGSGIRSYFEKIDAEIPGFEGGDLTIIAGRPSMGKTAFCISLALKMALKGKIPLAIFSLEMSKEQLVDRIMCGEAQVNIHQFRTGTLPKRDCPKLSFVAGPLSESNIEIDDTPAISVLELRSKVRRLKRTKKIQAVIIDYLQLMSGSGKHESRQAEISYISRNLKKIAKETGLPIFALSQLSRANELRNDKRPQLSDLRESGAIEQDADIVMFVYRDEVYNPNDEKVKGVAEIIIGKQRNGPIGTCKLAFIKEFARFEDLVENYGELSFGQTGGER